MNKKYLEKKLYAENAIFSRKNQPAGAPKKKTLMFGLHFSCGYAFSDIDRL
jgi:hypothetical protein